MKVKAKGTRAERAMVALHEKEGIECKRVPGSGAFEMLPGDLRVERQWQAEVKQRKNPPQTLDRWLAANDLLFIREDGKPREPRVYMTWRMYVRLMKAWQEVHWND